MNNEQPVNRLSNLNGNALGNSHARRFNASHTEGDWLAEVPKKGRKYIRDQREFFEKSGLLTVAEAFRASTPQAGEKPSAVTDEMKEKLQLGFLVPPILRPVFTKMVETEEDRTAALYTDNIFTLFLNREVPYPECYTSSGKFGNAGMSLVHMLACPNERIYNTVSLRPSDTGILEHMKMKVLELMKDPAFKEKCIQQLDPKMVPYTDLADEYEADKVKFMNTGPDQMRFYFHVHPTHSVGHLHMHCLQNNLRTSFINEYKNTKYDDVIAVLNKEMSS